MNNYTNNMKNHSLLIIPALIAAISAPGFVSARENVGGNKTISPPSINAACVEPSMQSDLAVNNVRTRILCGDMWWDLSNGIYEIPKGGGLHSIFAGSLWIGGIDAGGQLKVAAQTYRQTGNDFWPGPLDTANASVDFDVCAKYDKHFRITRKEVEDFVATGTTTAAILNWPGNGDQSKGQAQYLAPFFDKNADGIYSASAGDYPGYDLFTDDNYGGCQQVNCVPVDQLFGDETLFWVFNDKGNIHGETGAQSIGLEIRAQAFAFFTDDEINNMTFYNYRIFNRSTFRVDSCYFGVWCDADLGEYTDDYVGCDVKRGLGYTYNGDNYDEPPTGYGNNPPAIGIDFFRGPIADAGDGKDNDRNCQSDESCEQIIMSGFLYYDNETSAKGNPSGATHFYNYLRMKWGNGLPVQYGGNGFGSGGPSCNFMFPGNPTTDEHDWGIGGNCSTIPTLPAWDEYLAGTTAADRRMLETAGPFTLQPGAVNVITTGVVWAKATSGGAQASVKLLQVVDDKAQALFDNCFKVLDGPNAPDITVQELENELILYLSNTDPSSNNFNEQYSEFDPLIKLTDSSGNPLSVDTTYNFQGYKIFQVKDPTVSASDLDNTDKARLIAQCDIKDGISRIINFEFDQALGAGVPTEKVEGANLGITHSIKVTTDAFAVGAPTLINHKTYYFMAIAYGHNEFKKYQEDTPPVSDPFAPATDGQKKPYKQGRKNIKTYSGIPHMSTLLSGGTETHAEYGDAPAVTRREGNGNGGMNLELSSATVNAILAASDNRVTLAEYAAGKGPVNVKVVDPLNVPDGHSFTLKFDSAASITYTLLSGAFQIGDTVEGVLSGATAIVTSDNGIIMHIGSITNGPFNDGETVNKTVNGIPTGASAKIIVYSEGTTAVTSINKHLIDNATWILVNNTTGEKVYSEKTIKAVNEHLIPKWGLSITIEQVGEPGSVTSVNNGFLNASMTFSDPNKKWLTGLADQDGPFFTNWIRSGTIRPTGIPPTADPFQDDYVVDDDQIYEGVIGGTWTPYRLCACSDIAPPSNPFNPAKYHMGPGFKLNTMAEAQMVWLASVDVIITSDKSKWTRSVVLEMCEDSMYSVTTSGESTRARKLDYRRAPSVDKNGAANYPATDNNDFATGMGWFPGYAINVETGERLNIAFGENSALTQIAGKGVINYNTRATLAYGSLVGGPFINGENITSYATPSYTASGTASVVSAAVPGSMVVHSISGIISISPGNIIVGTSSGAKANVSSFTTNAFQLGETVTGTTSGATGTVSANMSSTSVMVISSVSGTFTANEEITGSTSGAVATVTTYSPYNFQQNGADMIWNPKAATTGAVPWTASASSPVFGGQHYIYVFGHNKDNDPSSPTPNDLLNIPRYDKGNAIRTILAMNNNLPVDADKRQVFNDAMWVNIPLLASGYNLLETDVTVKLRVAKSYKPGYSPAFKRDGNKIIYTDTASAPENANLPLYTFNTEGLSTHKGEVDVAKGALDLIKVVPNPYYAYSNYEKNALDNRVKITNLPESCTVSIYNLSGTLIRKYNKGQALDDLKALSSQITTVANDVVITTHDQYVDWDLKNTAGIPIASGVYIIHVEVPFTDGTTGEKVIKWFGIMRPIDLDSF